MLEPSAPFDIAVRTASSGVSSFGSQRQHLRSASRDLESIRPYRHGDPLRLIDWRTFARTDQVLVREHRQHVRQRMALVVQVGSCMFWPDFPIFKHIQPSKLECALRLATHLAYAYLRQGDLVELWAKNGDAWPKHRYRPQTSSDLIRLHADLVESKFQLAPLWGIMRDTTFAAQDYATVFAIDDGLSGGRLLDLLHGCADAQLLHLLSTWETKLDWIDTGTSYFDYVLRHKEYLGESMLENEAYQRQIQAWMSRLREQCRAQDIGYAHLTDQTEVAIIHQMINDRSMGTDVF